jgi:hypothetical protein
MSAYDYCLIFWKGAAAVIFGNAKITLNAATSQGGGVQLAGGELTQNGDSISGNICPYDPDISEGLH